MSCSTSSEQHKVTHILLQSRPQDSFLGQMVWGVLRCVSGFSGSSAGKESPCNAGDPSLIPGLGRSLEKGKAIPSSTVAWRIPWRCVSLSDRTLNSAVAFWKGRPLLPLSPCSPCHLQGRVKIGSQLILKDGALRNSPLSSCFGKRVCEPREARGWIGQVLRDKTSHF